MYRVASRARVTSPRGYKPMACARAGSTTSASTRTTSTSPSGSTSSCWTPSLLDTPNFGVPVQWLGLGETQLHLFIREAEPQSHHHFGITVEDLEPVYRRAEAMGAFDGRSTDTTSSSCPATWRRPTCATPPAT